MESHRFSNWDEGASSKGLDKCRESDDGSHEVRSRPGSSVEVRAERERPAPHPTSRPVTRRNAGLWEAATKIFGQIWEIGPTVGTGNARTILGNTPALLQPFVKLFLLA